MENTPVLQIERRSKRVSERGYATALVEAVDAVTMDLKGATGWPRFGLGKLVVTPLAERYLESEDIIEGLVSHGLTEWGCISQADRYANHQALEQGGRLLSRYHASNGHIFWIATEWDREGTTVFMGTEA